MSFETDPQQTAFSAKRIARRTLFPLAAAGLGFVFIPSDTLALLGKIKDYPCPNASERRVLPSAQKVTSQTFQNLLDIFQDALQSKGTQVINYPSGRRYVYGVFNGPSKTHLAIRAGNFAPTSEITIPSVSADWVRTRNGIQAGSLRAYGDLQEYLLIGTKDYGAVRRELEKRQNLEYLAEPPPVQIGDICNGFFDMSDKDTQDEIQALQGLTIDKAMTEKVAQSIVEHNLFTKPQRINGSPDIFSSLVVPVFAGNKKDQQQLVEAGSN